MLNLHAYCSVIAEYVKSQYLQVRKNDRLSKIEVFHRFIVLFIAIASNLFQHRQVNASPQYYYICSTAFELLGLFHKTRAVLYINTLLKHF